jgi:hypothetical protein
MPTFASFLILNDLYSVPSVHLLLATIALFQLLNVLHTDASEQAEQVLVPTFASFLPLKASAQMNMDKHLVFIFSHSQLLNGLEPSCI